MYLISNYNESGWNHLALVKDGTHDACWINGQQLTQQDTEYWSSVNGLSIGGRSDGSSLITAKISDLRLYCTSLTGQDVQELYRTRCTIDKNGVLSTYML